MISRTGRKGSGPLCRRSWLGNVRPGAYQPTPEAVADLRLRLPEGWERTLPTLISRSQDEAGWISSYKIGPEGNSRLFVAVSDVECRMTDLAISADPGNR